MCMGKITKLPANLNIFTVVRKINLLLDLPTLMITRLYLLKALLLHLLFLRITDYTQLQQQMSMCYGSLNTNMERPERIFVYQTKGSTGNNFSLKVSIVTLAKEGT